MGQCTALPLPRASFYLFAQKYDQGLLLVLVLIFYDSVSAIIVVLQTKLRTKKY